MVKKLLIRIWLLIEFGVKSYLNFTFRKKNVFRVPLIIVTTQLMAELGEMASSDYLEPLYQFIKEEYGSFIGILVKVLGDFITGNYTSGFSWGSIIIKLFLIFLFCFLAYSKEQGIKITWKWFWGWNWNWRFFSNNNVTLINNEHEFKISDSWFDEINKTYRLNKNKFIKELHIESALEKRLFESIVDEQSKVNEYLQSLEKCKNALLKTNSRLYEFQLLVDDFKEPFVLSEKSQYFGDYNNIVESISDIINNLNQISELSQVRTNQHIEINKIDFPITISEFSDYINSYSFDLVKLKIKLSTTEKYSVRRRIFNAFSPILISIRDLNEAVDELNEKKLNIIRNHFIVHATAGVGKTYFAAHIYHSLKEKEHFPLFIPASAFSGNHSSLSHAFQKVFRYSEAISLNEFFSKLNDFAKNKNKRIVLIIDGMNETTYNLSGFSPIWREGIENLTEDIYKYEGLTFLATCRTSYLENNIDPTFSMQCSYKLTGFEDFEIRKKAIQKYFEYYKIKSNIINSRNSRLFSIPLVLRIYCVGKNGDRISAINEKLNHNSYEETLYRFVNAECYDIADKLDRPSTTPIYNGISRCSEKMVQEITASLDYDDFLELTQAKTIDEILKSTSIGCRFLESELLFMKDVQPYFKGERVVHTFQNVGGYMLANFLFSQYDKPNDFIDSNEYKTLLVGVKRDRITGELNKNSHQLALDIMLFMVYQYSKNNNPDYTDDLIDYTQDPLVLGYSWRFVFDYWGVNASKRVEKKLKLLAKNLNLWDGLFELTIDEYIDNESPFNFKYIKEFLLQNEPNNIELTWVKNIYENRQIFANFLKVDYLRYTDSQLNISLELTIWLLESTSHRLRDEASKKLLEFGSKEPKFILNKIKEYSSSGRLYIYERLSGIAYGICLLRQNDQSFISNELKLFAETAYELQFSNEPSAPTFHYIIIDSFKHIIDLAEHLGVFKVPMEEKERFAKYKFNPSEDWQTLSEEEKANVSLEWKAYPDPDPLSGDFVTYTIPRLLNSKEEGHIDAVAHIYKRLISNGYIPDAHKNMPEGIEREFYSGGRLSDSDGKVDRLGKKYSWNALFEYAGYLLNSEKLPTIYQGDTSVSPYYERLSDVDIEVSNPSREPINKKLFSTKLLADKSNSEKWTYIEKFGSIKEVFSLHFESNEYTLLYGYFEESQMSKHSFDVRSFLLVEPFLVNEEDIEGKKEQILNRTIEWDHDFHFGNTISKTYFGELYWADTITDLKKQTETIPSTEMHEVDRTIIPKGLSFIEQFHAKEVAKKGKEMVPIQIPLTIEPAIVEYLWESDSEIYPSLRGNIPSPNIGKYLNLKADPARFQILDKNSKRAFISVNYEEKETLRQDSNYIRTDLLKKYLKDHNLVLMYQIKQHTFDRKAGDGTGDFRGMQFKIQEL